jgi:triosephosphate isomerase
MLVDAGCEFVILGHSERRQYFLETDEVVNRKLRAALVAGLKPIFCLGETLAERESGEFQSVVKRQLEKGLASLTPLEVSRIIIAYEPVWAIGTGKTATPETAQEAHLLLRRSLELLCGKEVASTVRILYGGSVKPTNTMELMRCADIDGALVGGASLDVESFAGIVTHSKQKLL